MGIKNLAKLLSEKAPDCITEHDIKNYMGRIVAIDASMFLYQFLIAVRQQGIGGQLTNDAGEVTSHLSGFFYRTIRMRENGLKPVYVFDGKPPEMKSGELLKRKEKRQKAQKALEEAQKADDTAKVIQQERRLVKAEKWQVEETKKLLKFMGIPYVEATCEAEATCAEMCKAGLVYATATEDMDAMTFGTCKQLRGLHHSESRKQPVKEFTLKKALEQMEFTMDQFIDFCILCGCDYTSTISKVGPKTAFNLISKHKNIETMIKNIDTVKKHPIPADFDYVNARRMFKAPDVTDCKKLAPLKWPLPDEEGLIGFMCDQKSFSIDRMKKGIERLKKARGKSSQKRLDMFFKVKPSTKKKKVPKGKGKKRKNSVKSTQKKKKRKI